MHREALPQRPPVHQPQSPAAPPRIARIAVPSFHLRLPVVVAPPKIGLPRIKPQASPAPRSKFPALRGRGSAGKHRRPPSPEPTRRIRHASTPTVPSSAAALPLRQERGSAVKHPRPLDAIPPPRPHRLSIPTPKGGARDHSPTSVIPMSSFDWASPAAGSLPE